MTTNCNPVCIWCGYITNFSRADSGESQFECRNKSCVAMGTPVVRAMLEEYPVPHKIEAWGIELVFNQDEDDEHVEAAGWLGMFATEELALERAEEALGYSTGKMAWAAIPITLKFEGGV